MTLRKPRQNSVLKEILHAFACFYNIITYMQLYNVRKKYLQLHRSVHYILKENECKKKQIKI